MPAAARGGLTNPPPRGSDLSIRTEQDGRCSRRIARCCSRGIGKSPPGVRICQSEPSKMGAARGGLPVVARGGLANPPPGFGFVNPNRARWALLAEDCPLLLAGDWQIPRRGSDLSIRTEQEGSSPRTGYLIRSSFTLKHFKERRVLS
ncbi:hypothetical protein QUF80_03770 [Desulfococcaceae bacterium HSG8]|nr:hypothetical protein [Desulfococcaceae bacterium HSG8]